MCRQTNNLVCCLRKKPKNQVLVCVASEERHVITFLLVISFKGRRKNDIVLEDDNKEKETLTRDSHLRLFFEKKN